MPYGDAGRQIEAFEIHAFSERIHGGNPAGVCLLDEWFSSDEMRRIAQDFGPSVTAFVLNSTDGIHPLRWFTRGGREVDSFCGHATFSAAHVMLRIKQSKRVQLEFRTVSGVQHVGRSGQFLNMTVPFWPVEEIPCPDLIQRSIDLPPAACFRGKRDVLLVYGSETEVERLQPDYTIMRSMGHSGVIATAKCAGNRVVYRFFCPGFSIGENEDHASGSALSSLAPYWTAKLGTPTFYAFQASARGGSFICSVEKNVITVSSQCVTFLSGAIVLPRDIAS